MRAFLRLRLKAYDGKYCCQLSWYLRTKTCLSSKHIHCILRRVKSSRWVKLTMDNLFAWCPGLRDFERKLCCVLRRLLIRLILLLLLILLLRLLILLVLFLGLLISIVLPRKCERVSWLVRRWGTLGRRCTWWPLGWGNSKGTGRNSWKGTTLYVPAVRHPVAAAAPVKVIPVTSHCFLPMGMDWKR